MIVSEPDASVVSGHVLGVVQEHVRCPGIQPLPRQRPAKHTLASFDHDASGSRVDRDSGHEAVSIRQVAIIGDGREHMPGAQQEASQGVCLDVQPVSLLSQLLHDTPAQKHSIRPSAY